jgi:hypothetical protein
VTIGIANLRDPKSRIGEGRDAIVVKETLVGAWCLFT